MKYKYSKSTSSTTNINVFNSTTAFFTPLLAPSCKSLYAYHAGKSISAEEVEKKGSSCQITYFFGVRNKVCPLIERLRAVGVEITEYTYIQDCVDAGRLLDRAKYLFEPKSSTSKLKMKQVTAIHPPLIPPSIYIPSNLSVISYPPTSASDSDSSRSFLDISHSNISGISVYQNEVQKEEEKRLSEKDPSGGENNSENIESSGTSSSESSPQSKDTSHHQKYDRSASSSLSPTNQFEPQINFHKRKRTRSVALEVEEEPELIVEGPCPTITELPVVVLVKEEEEEEFLSPSISSTFPPSNLSIYKSILDKSNNNIPTTIPISTFLEAVTNLLRIDGNLEEMTREERSGILRGGLEGIDTGGGGFTGKRIKKGD